MFFISLKINKTRERLLTCTDTCCTWQNDEFNLTINDDYISLNFSYRTLQKRVNYVLSQNLLDADYESSKRSLCMILFSLITDITFLWANLSKNLYVCWGSSEEMVHRYSKWSSSLSLLSLSFWGLLQTLSGFYCIYLSTDRLSKFVKKLLKMVQ